MDKEKLTKELIIQTARSGGKGGQHVNKVETQVQIKWHIASSNCISEEEKLRLLDQLHARLNKNGELFIQSSEKRTQLENKDLAIEKLITLIKKCLIQKKKRVKTKIPKAVLEKRKKSKMIQSAKKEDRKGKFI